MAYLTQLITGNLFWYNGLPNPINNWRRDATSLTGELSGPSQLKGLVLWREEYRWRDCKGGGVRIWGKRLVVKGRKVRR